MNMKKTLSMALAATMVCGALTACGNKDTEKPEDNKPTETPDVETPEVETPEVDTNVEVDIEKMMETITTNAYLPMMMPAGEAELEALYGINPGDVESYIINIPMMNVQATEIAIFKVADAEKAEVVKAGIQKRVSDLDNTWKQYLPDQYELVKNHQILAQGNYIMFSISDYNDYIKNVFDRAFDPSIEEMVLPVVFEQMLGVTVLETVEGGFVVENKVGEKTFKVKVTIDPEVTYVEGEFDIAAGTVLDVSLNSLVKEGENVVDGVYEAVATYVAQAVVEEDTTTEEDPAADAGTPAEGTEEAGATETPAV